MALKHLLDLNKTDRYTADGRDKINELQAKVTEDVKYKTGDISQKTGLQKQPDGSWAPPKGGAGSNKKNITNAEGKLSERAKFAYQEHAKKISKESLESLIRNKNKAFEKHNDEIAEIFKEELARRNKKDTSKNEFYKDDIRTEAGEKKILSETKTEVLQSKIKDLEETKKKNGGKLGVYGEKSLQLAKEELAKRSKPAEGLESKSTEELTNLFNELATKSVREKSPENSAERDRVYKELKRRQKAESNPTDKYKDLPGAQKKDALYASTFEGSSIGMTQTSMERNGWDLVQADDNVNVYAKPDGSKVTMKHDGKKITSSEYEAPGSAESKPAENPDYPFKPKTSEERAERAKFEKDRDDFIERMNTYREESNQWTKRSKGERTATLVDWLDDWDKHPEEKNDAAYTAIERELASRGVKRENRAAAKEADNRERNEFYRRAYDSAPRQLTGDCRIRVRRS